MKPWLVAALVALGAVVLWQRAEVRRAHDGRVAAEATARSLGRIADSIARVRVATTDTFTVERERWRTLVRTDTLLRIHPETLVVRAEEAIAACDRALNACTAEVGVLREARDSLLSAVTLRDREARGCRVLGVLPCPEVVAGYSALGANGTIYHGPGVLVGFRIW